IVQDINRESASAEDNLATVLFADAKTGDSDLEKRFDAIVKRHHLTRVKNDGEALLCLDNSGSDNIAKALNVMQAANALLKEAGDSKISVGIHSGPLVAGVVGIRKTEYDIWGDTVNIAARIEQHGETGKITVSEDTYELVKTRYQGLAHGEIAMLDH